MIFKPKDGPILHPLADGVDFWAFDPGAFCCGLGFNILEVL